MKTVVVVVMMIKHNQQHRKVYRKKERNARYLAIDLNHDSTVLQCTHTFSFLADIRRVVPVLEILGNVIIEV